ncbi:helix-turn-helix domain-containing protein [Enterococcus mundtii]|nr:helix-turn-helix domain-containing protein [Enterococcus mundtii]
MMDLLLHNKTYSTEQLSDYLMISRSSIFNIIRHMNEVLKEYRISIATGPLTFIGKEEDIRFYSFLFIQALVIVRSSILIAITMRIQLSLMVEKVG